MSLVQFLALQLMVFVLYGYMLMQVSSAIEYVRSAWPTLPNGRRSLYLLLTGMLALLMSIPPFLDGWLLCWTACHQGGMP